MKTKSLKYTFDVSDVFNEWFWPSVRVCDLVIGVVVSRKKSVAGWSVGDCKKVTVSYNDNSS